MRRQYGSLKIVGETVAIQLRKIVGRDRFGDDIVEYSEPVNVDNVLVKPSSDTSMTSSTRNVETPGHPDAIETDVIFYFPRNFRTDMRGARVICRDVTYDVAGSPTHYIDANLPWQCDWNMVVKGERHDG